MSDDVFEAKIQSGPNGPRIELLGTVNKAAQASLEEAYRDAAGQPGEIVLDFTQVDYINSTGIAVIVGVLAIARSSNREIGAIGLTDHYREVFQITRLSDFMHIYEDAPAGP